MAHFSQLMWWSIGEDAIASTAHTAACVSGEVVDEVWELAAVVLGKGGGDQDGEDKYLFFHVFIFFGLILTIHNKKIIPLKNSPQITNYPNKN